MVDQKQLTNCYGTSINPFLNGISIMEDLYSATQSGLAGMFRYSTDFFIPYMISTSYFQLVETEKMSSTAFMETFRAYMGLLDNNIELMNRSLDGTAKMMLAYAEMNADELNEAMQESVLELKHDKLLLYVQRQADLLEHVTHHYPKAIDSIAPEFGFHFERGDHTLFDETDRFLLYRVSPSINGVTTRMDAKPLLIIPPFVLGHNILGFLPGEQRSYAHCYANLGYPTYIRVLKSIATTPALQVMTGEDDARDTRRFCAAIMKAHGKPVTLNGYCQGGYNSLCDLLSGELDDLVDAFLTCVTPIDGTRSKGLSKFLQRLPQRFNDMAYGTKTLPNGNKVTDGDLMGWIYKLKSIENEIPATVFLRDLMMFARQSHKEGYRVSKTAAALNYWLQNERWDLPVEITRMSFASYNEPITPDGTLPVRLFGKKLNIKRIAEKKIPWLICYGTHDDLVEPEPALAPLDYIKVEVTPFPKGHVAIATSWSHPDSEYALHTRFGDENYRGPVRFHMDLDDALNESRNVAAKAQAPDVAVLPSPDIRQEPPVSETRSAGTESAEPDAPTDTTKAPAVKGASTGKNSTGAAEAKTSTSGAKKKP